MERRKMYKGTDLNMQCHDGFQFKIGVKYHCEGEIKACGNGFHSCERPADVFGYFAPSGSRFFEVEIWGDFHSDGDKTASENICFLKEFSPHEFNIEIARDNFEKSDKKKLKTASGPSGAATASGDSGAATASGDSGAATASGFSGAATAAGFSGAATASGDRGAATASGDRGAATASGFRGAATASGKQSVACGLGYKNRAMAGDDSWIVLTERNDDFEIIGMRCGKAGVDIKPNVFYELINGEFVECEQ